MSAMCYMKGLVDASRKVGVSAGGARAEPSRTPAWVEWRLQQMEEERFIAEALAHEVIGRLEHPQTKSLRLESAAAKMLVSEANVAVSPGMGFGHGGEGYVRFALIENEQRIAQAIRNLRRTLTKL